MPDRKNKIKYTKFFIFKEFYNGRINLIFNWIIDSSGLMHVIKLVAKF